ncbi:MAG: hypothetical protein ABFD46_05065 [Armatimonadota bacterium]
MISGIDEMMGFVSGHKARHYRLVSALVGTLAVVTQVCTVALHSVALAATAFALLAWSSWHRHARFMIRYFLRCK